MKREKRTVEACNVSFLVFVSVFLFSIISCSEPEWSEDDLSKENSGSNFDGIDFFSDTTKGSFSRPLSINETISFADSLRDSLASMKKKVWITGHIVGTINKSIKSGISFSTPTNTASNILLCDTCTDTDFSCCVPVELLSGSKIRKTMNLKDNPELLGAKIKLRGQITTYYSVTGLKKTDKFFFDTE